MVNRVIDGTKRCSVCREVKTLNQFNRRGRLDSRPRPSCIACRKQRLYGIAPDEQRQMFEDQGGCCALCREEFKGSFYLDHDHATGKPRGLLCKKCNWDLGKHGAEWFARAAIYLSAR
jgi:hypothetical protein